MTIVPATAPEQLGEVRRLFEEYAASLSFDLAFQNFAAELDGLPGEYTPPGGGLWLAVADSGEAAGCIALRRLESEVGEMKRLYVRPAHRGTGLGKGLARRVLEEAVALGFRHVRLDTTLEMVAAIGLYESLGFKPIAPYRPNPVAGARFLEIELAPV
jgi:ribosomal protein S18 acetylase RimI-like enzyme